MPLYYVKVFEVHSGSVEVEANSQEEALEKAREKYEDDDLDEDMSFDYIMDKVDWDVEKVEVDADEN